MLLRHDGSEGVLAIGQASHAWISGQLARAWGNAEFARPEPFDAVCLAAEQHDIGMAGWDLRPDIDAATGMPLDFMHMPLRTHLELWRAAPRTLIAQSTLAALLVSCHGESLQRLRNLDALPPEEAAAVRDHIAGQVAFQERLARTLGEPPERISRNRRLIWTWDGLSLALLLGWDPYTAGHVPTVDGGHADLTLSTIPGAFALTPWPFAEPELSVCCEGRRLNASAADAAALARSLAEAPVERVELTLRAG